MFSYISTLIFGKRIEADVFVSGEHNPEKNDDEAVLIEYPIKLHEITSEAALAEAASVLAEAALAEAALVESALVESTLVESALVESTLVESALVESAPVQNDPNAQLAPMLPALVSIGRVCPKCKLFFTNSYFKKKHKKKRLCRLCRKG